mmetsp:Transcript_14739/g.42199  ORF Transcript_14739/g.42199 Transcript_14739/m.42199 type:complete len:305 (-) Transcript_14739:57-971(-)
MSMAHNWWQCILLAHLDPFGGARWVARLPHLADAPGLRDEAPHLAPGVAAGHGAVAHGAPPGGQRAEEAAVLQHLLEHRPHLALEHCDQLHAVHDERGGRQGPGLARAEGEPLHADVGVDVYAAAGAPRAELREGRPVCLWLLRIDVVHRVDQMHRGQLHARGEEGLHEAEVELQQAAAERGVRDVLHAGRHVYQSGDGAREEEVPRVGVLDPAARAGLVRAFVQLIDGGVLPVVGPIIVSDELTAQLLPLPLAQFQLRRDDVAIVCDVQEVLLRVAVFHLYPVGAHVASQDSTIQNPLRPAAE